MLPLSASLVVYRTEASDLSALFAALSESALSEWTVVDNGAPEDAAAGERLREAVEAHGGSYVAARANLGFGAGHNLALASQLQPKAEFHLMVNPDITFEPTVLRRLIAEMEARTDVGLIMPKVLYEDGAYQPVCKLLPTPWDFALRRFAPAAIKRALHERLDRYEMSGVGNRECDKVPFLSGCFLFARRSVLDRIGGFDDRFFLYLEDVDLCRRVADHSKLLYWPHVSVMHGCFRGAYRNRKLMFLFLRSATAYFNKWGWLFDRKRKLANRAALACLR